MNAVKLELGIILCIGVLLWLVIGRLHTSPAAQIAGLGAYGIAGMLWLLRRTRRVLQRARQDGEDRLQPPLAP